jgi:hypothetical protein
MIDTQELLAPKTPDANKLRDALRSIKRRSISPANFYQNYYRFNWRKSGFCGSCACVAMGNETFWKVALQVGGGATVLAIVGAFLFFSLYKQWLSLPIFPQLTKKQTFTLMRIFLCLIFSALALFILAYIQTTREIFPLTVYVHGEAGTGDMILKNSGYVVVDLGSDRRREPIEDKGQAYFPSIPSSFRGQEVPVSIDAEGFEVNDPNQKHRLDSSDLYLFVRRKSGHVAGWVQDEKNQPVVGAFITIGTNTTSSDASGHFDLSIPGDQLKSELLMQVLASKFKLSREEVVPNANDTTITLRRNP